MKFNKISPIILYVLFAISAVLAVLFYWKGIPEIDQSMAAAKQLPDVLSGKITDAQAAESNQLNIFLQWAAILFYIALAVTLIFQVIHFVGSLINAPKSALKSLAGIALIVVVFLIAKTMADPTLLVISGYTGPDDTTSWMIWSDTLLYGVYGLSGIAVLTMLGTSIWNIFK